MKSAPASTGWYLCLRYFRGVGVKAQQAESLVIALSPADPKPNFVYAEDAALATSAWRSLLADWAHALPEGGHLGLWITDCRHGAVAEGGARVTLPEIVEAVTALPNMVLCEADLIEGHCFVVAQKNGAPREVWRKHARHALIIRTGGHGDLLMAASVFPALRREGYRISLLTHPLGEEVLRADPHLEEIITYLPAQLREAEVPAFWQAWGRRFDRVIHLGQSVEGELLKQPWRADYFWSDAQRRAMCGRSYLSYLHQLAGVDSAPQVRFYPTAEEEAWANARAAELSPFVLWVLKGSAVHKWWPYAPEAMCQILAHSERDNGARIVLAGGADSLPLENDILDAAIKYHGDASRIYSLVDQRSIREVMALAMKAAVVVGPETGILNAVSMMDVPKVLMLSHSSPANLSDDWVSTTALTPRAACYPCHRLHQGHEWCPQDTETGAAVCAASLRVQEVVGAVLPHLQRKTEHDGLHLAHAAGG